MTTKARASYGLNRSTFVAFRVSREEMAALKKAASERKVGVSELVRSVLFKRK